MCYYDFSIIINYTTIHNYYIILLWLRERICYHLKTLQNLLLTVSLVNSVVYEAILEIITLII